jgi:cation:H+ antiporter
LASGTHHGLPILARQREELLLTAAQSVFGLAVLASRSISVREAGALLGLFWFQFLLGAVLPSSAHGAELVIVSVIYFGLAAVMMVRNRRHLGSLLRDGLRTPYSQLVGNG